MGLANLLTFLCLNLGWSQTLPLITATPPVILNLAPASGTPSAAPSSTPTDALNRALESTKVSVVKYDEYKSFCRENEYDQIANLTPTEKQKRITQIAQIFKQSPTEAVKIKFLKELIDQKKFEEVDSFHTTLQAEKNWSDSGLKIVEALMNFRRGDLKKAVQLLSKVVIENPKNAAALQILAEYYKRDANYFEAVAAYLDLSKITKNSFDFELCVIYTLDAQYTDADRHCKRASQHDPSNPYTSIYLGIIQREKLIYDEAILFFKNSLRKKQTEMGFTCLGEAYALKKNQTLAAEAFKRALRIRGDSTRAISGLAWSQLKLKDYKMAIETFKQSCSKNPLIILEIQRAFKYLNDEKNPNARLFADAAQACRR